MGGIAAVIVNYRTAALVTDCLRSLAPEARSRGDLRAVVVDNASEDGSVSALREAVRDHGWAGWVDILALNRNGGFAAGNNAALRPILASPSPPDYLWLLNPDTVVRPSACAALVAELDVHPSVGLVGSRLEDPDGTPQRSAFRFPGVVSEWERGARLGLITRAFQGKLVAPPVCDRPHAADWLSGASLMVRRQVFERVGLLDEGYFLYYEELDFCRRARRERWMCRYVPASRVVHFVSQSTGLPGDSAETPKRMPMYWFASRQRYFAKQRRPLDSLVADVAWAVGHTTWRARRRLQGKPDTDPPGLLTDFLKYNYLLRRNRSNRGPELG